MHYSEWRPESQITAIAWSWIGSDVVEVEVLEQDLSNKVSMLERFLEAFNAADVVTGHYIRKHDLPLLNDHCMRYELPLLKPVLASDTMLDLPKVKALGKAQDNLAEILGLDAEKFPMNGAKWAIANELDAVGREKARKRVVDDVKQHKELRAKLVERRLLRGPREWRP